MAMIGNISATTASIGRFGESAAQAASRGEKTAGSFGGAVGAAVEQAQSLESRAQSTVMNMLRGNGVEVHDAMIQTQQAELAFELALQVRNKAVSAYQQMMQMQF